MRNLFFTLVVLSIMTFFVISCSGGPPQIYADYERCFLLLKEDDHVEKEISLTHLPAISGIRTDQGLWCNEESLRGAVAFDVYQERWGLYFAGNNRLAIQLYPIGGEGGARSQSISVNLVDRGCDVFKKAGQVFHFPEVFTTDAKRFSLSMQCRQ